MLARRRALGPHGAGGRVTEPMRDTMQQTRPVQAGGGSATTPPYGITGCQARFRGRPGQSCNAFPFRLAVALPAC